MADKQGVKGMLGSFGAGVLALLLTFAQAVQAAPAEKVISTKTATPKAEVITSLTKAQLHDLMKAEGYAVSFDEDGDLLWKIDGLRTFLFAVGEGDSLQFHVAFSDGNATLEKVNAWNRDMRYSRNYLDESGDPHLELDLDLAGGVTQARVLDFIKTCQISLQQWIDAVVR
ncbi:MAG: hypothetical protein Kow0096_17360 [Thiohalomonadaceae bacterium]